MKSQTLKLKQNVVSGWINRGTVTIDRSILERLTILSTTKYYFTGLIRYLIVAEVQSVLSVWSGGATCLLSSASTGLSFSFWMLMVCFLEVFLLWKPMAFASRKVGDRTGVTLQAWQITREKDVWTGKECWRWGIFISEAGNPIIDDNFAGFNNFQNRIWAWGLMRLTREEKMTKTWFQKVA